MLNDVDGKKCIMFEKILFILCCFICSIYFQYHPALELYSSAVKEMIGLSFKWFGVNLLSLLENAKDGPKVTSKPF